MTAHYYLGFVIAVVACAACGDAAQPEKPRLSSDAGAHDNSDGGASLAAAPEEISISEIRVGDLVFRARMAGPTSGEPVILLHGFPQNSYEWRGPLRALAHKGYRAIAPDQRGYSAGARPSAVDGYRIPDIARDVTDIADALGIGKFHVVGHDWGAGVAWFLAVLARDRLLSLSTLSVPHPDAQARELQNKDSCQYKASAYFDLFVTPQATDYFASDDFRALRMIYAGVTEQDVDVYMRELANRETIDAALNWYRANVPSRDANGAPLGKIAVPTLFIWSDGDTALCREGAEKTQEFVAAEYRFEIVPGVNHWLVDNAPEQVSALLLEHIAKHSSAD